MIVRRGDLRARPVTPDDLDRANGRVIAAQIVGNELGALHLRGCFSPQ